jgi:hypothetical protein
MPTARGEEAPDERTSNLRRLDKVKKLWMQMPSVRVQPSVVSYGTLIKAVDLMQQWPGDFSSQRRCGRESGQLHRECPRTPGNLICSHIFI